MFYAKIAEVNTKWKHILIDGKIEIIMIRLGIVGWGYWGRNYAKYLDTTIDAQLEWVCDLREGMLEDAKKRHPHLKVTKKIEDLVKDKLDGVVLATPATTHYKLAKFFIENRVNILIEKPLTTSVKEAIKLLSLTKKKKVKVLVGLTFLYNQAVRWIKTRIDNGYFGKVYYLEFRRQSYGPIRDDVNVVWDFAPHDLSITSWFLNGKKPLKIYAKAKKFSRNYQEDIAIITLEYPNNILANINVAWLYPVKIRNLTLLGDKRMVVFEDTNVFEPLKIYNTTVEYPSEKDPYGAGFRLGDILIPRIKPIDPLYTQIKHFVNYLQDQEAALSPLQVGLENVLLLEAINYSLQTSKEIDFEKYIRKYDSLV